MELAIITVKQVLELFVLIISGIFLYKKNIIREDGKKLLSDILIKFVVPCMIINSYIIIDLYVILYLAYQVLSKQVI